MNGMQQEILAMTYKELDRIKLIAQCLEKQLTQRQAAKALGITEQHLKRLIDRHVQMGPSGLISRHRGKPSNNRLSSNLKETAISIIKRDFYDYGPTLAAEKLQEYHHIQISKETTRQWMIEAGIWRAHQKRIPKIHPSRERRSCLGELIQIDGSDHDWFEERGPRCTLLVFIDDATSQIQKLFFCNDETTINYFMILKDYILAHGVPRAFYFDKHGVFRVNHPEAKRGNGLTQFGRVLQTLGIEPIFAHSPQAKGRVERSNGILQDRLVKALRYHGISDMKAGNDYLEKFRQEYNAKFAKPAMNNTDVHRPLTEQEKNNLNRILSFQINRVISKDMLVRHNNVIYKINEPEQTRNLRQAPVVVCEELSGKISIYHQNKPLNYEVYRKNLLTEQVLNRASANRYLNRLVNLEKNWRPTVIANKEQQYEPPSRIRS
jgi:hypothetical protein